MFDCLRWHHTYLRTLLRRGVLGASAAGSAARSELLPFLRLPGPSDTLLRRLPSLSDDVTCAASTLADGAAGSSASVVTLGVAAAVLCRSRFGLTSGTAFLVATTGRAAIGGGGGCGCGVKTGGGASCVAAAHVSTLRLGPRCSSAAFDDARETGADAGGVAPPSDPDTVWGSMAARLILKLKSHLGRVEEAAQLAHEPCAP